MSEPNPPPPDTGSQEPPPAARVAVPQARASRSRWAGLVWAVPLAAVLIVGFLGIRALFERGIDVVVTFETGAGARVGDTKVIYQGVDAGHVTKIAINEDGRRVDLTLRLDRRAERGLTTTTKFWLVGAVATLNDISSVKAALSGVSIGVAPGAGGTPMRHFIGLSSPPIIAPDTAGTAYALSTENLGTVSLGSSIFYHGEQIGRVTGIRFKAPGEFHLDVFILSPYDKLIVSSANFWISSPVQVSLTDKGASASLEHVGALLNGAIEFDNAGEKGAPHSSEGAIFPLYQSRKEAEIGPLGPEVPYSLRFIGAAGELIEGAPVRLLGFRIGSVKSVKLELDHKTGAASTTVLAVLYPSKLHLLPPGAAAAAASASAAASPSASASATPASGASEWRRATDEAVNRLLARGHRARLVQTPPVIGGRVISFDVVAGAGAATLGQRPGQLPSIPSDETSGGIEEMTSRVNQLLANLNRVPFEAIGRDVRQAVGHVNALVSSPQLAESLQHLNGTLGEADQMMRALRPQVGPLVSKLDRAADEAGRTATAARELLGGAGGGAAASANLPAAIQELTDAARSIRALTDYLGRHPEALIRGRVAGPSDEPQKDTP